MPNTVEEYQMFSILTTAPTEANEGPVKMVLLDAAPAQKYAGYIYFIRSN